jgi:hypothetical protein
MRNNFSGLDGAFLTASVACRPAGGELILGVSPAVRRALSAIFHLERRRRRRIFRRWPRNTVRAFLK